ncbi:ABC transporter ATP-binding protein [Jiangella rhizosphaerae]|uniref:ABC transporter ATP-binding protein n=1 Tax=Jiangella rhizosphaerae TaxID=2293569 RepID=A0A418KHF7_9ACTN|nr:ABC transporter ATP-binding protein [Jiangella rhizosphaerae]RIQ11320.1 ABC transporter ATP-binding protein [Jiangella rhizosphaerae]
MSAVTLRGLTKSFGQVRALDGVDLDVAAGESLVVLGPSGSGKSTLLRVVAGLERADAGSVVIGGVDQRDRATHERDVAIVFQHFALYPHLSAERNITLGLTHGLRMPKSEARDRARDVAERLQITELLDRLPRAMSGGQRQRVALARALARRAGVVLLDEPLSGLDAQLRAELRVEIAAILRNAGATAVHVTHDQLDAMAMADRIAVVRAGRIEQLGTPDDLYERPASEFVAGFIGSPPMNLFRSEFDGTAHRTLLAVLPPSGHHDVTLGVRPEHLSLTRDAPWTANGVVVLVEPAGPSKIVHVSLAGHTVTVRCAADVGVRAGETVPLGCSPGRVAVFGGPGRRYLGTADELFASRSAASAT